MKRFLLPVIFIVLLFFPYSCATIESAFDDLKKEFDLKNVSVSTEEVKAIADSAKGVAKSFEDITPEQEYYIGRAVGAVVLDQYVPYDNPEANSYINTLGQTLALASDRPELFSGYHFLILDSEEINAFATPSGLIFITRGMLRLTTSEDMAAAVLAHEIGHIVHKHGLKAIKQTRITSALGNVAATAAESVAPDALADLTNDFKDSIQDITNTMITSGYSKVNEFDADKIAVKILKRLGYDPGALLDLLNAMKNSLKPGAKDFAKTHPDPEERIKVAKVYIGKTTADDSPKVRRERFNKALSGI